MKNLLEINLLYQGEPRQVTPITIWFGATDFKTKQQWFMRVRDAESTETVDLVLEDMHDIHPVVKAVETTRITHPVRQKIGVQDGEEDREVKLDLIEDYSVGKRSN